MNGGWFRSLSGPCAVPANSSRCSIDCATVCILPTYLDKLDGRITTAFYDEKAAVWRQEQTALLRRINELRLTTQGYNDAINNIENTSTLCKAFPEQPAAEQRRLLRLL